MLNFHKSSVQILCGTDPFPVKYKAKKYKLHDHFLSKENFHQMMTNLPEYVSEDEVGFVWDNHKHDLMFDMQA